jgi:hypothetical protein
VYYKNVNLIHATVDKNEFWASVEDIIHLSIPFTLRVYVKTRKKQRSYLKMSVGHDIINSQFYPTLHYLCGQNYFEKYKSLRFV